MIEVDENGKPVIIKGPGGKTYIRGANGELIECDASGNPIKGGKVVKIGKDGKPMFDSEDGVKRDKFGNVIPAGKRVRMRPDGTYSVLTDEEDNDEDYKYDAKVSHKARHLQKNQNKAFDASKGLPASNLQ